VCWVVRIDVDPSPKSHKQLKLPEDVVVRFFSRKELPDKHCEVPFGNAKSATGAGYT